MVTACLLFLMMPDIFISLLIFSQLFLYFFRYCEIRLPSGEKRLIDKRCRATIGVVSNPEHGTKKLRKAGQSRWLGIRPTVRGVAMNPVDHPHGGGEGKSKSSGKHGQVSRTPWGKPTKSGYKTARTKKRKI